MADADDTAPTAPGRGSGRGGRRPAPGTSDPRVDGPAAPRSGRAAGRNRPSSPRQQQDPFGAVGPIGALRAPSMGDGNGISSPVDPLLASMPSPTAPPAGQLPAPPFASPPAPSQSAASEHARARSTGEVATTTLEPPSDPSLDRIPSILEAEQAVGAPSPGRPSLGTFGRRAGRDRNRPPSVSGRLPVITPQMPVDAPLVTRPNDPVGTREATPDQTDVLPGYVRSNVPTVLRTDLDVAPGGRHGDQSTLPSAEMLATLIEPEPLPQLMPDPDPDDASMSGARTTRSLPVVLRRRTRKRVRRVTRVVRHIDTWSVFKVALIFDVVLYVVCLTAGVLLWNVAYTTGTIDNVEKFFEQFGWSSFQFNGGAIYHHAWVAGLFAIVGLTGLAVLLATLFNLITDLVGGVRVSVLEEEVIARPVGAETTIVRRKPRRDRADRALHAVARLEQDPPVHPSSVRRTSMPRFKRRAVRETSGPAAPPPLAADVPDARGQWG